MTPSGLCATPLIPMQGVAWRWCGIHPGWAAENKHWLCANDPEISLPDDLLGAVPKRWSEFLAGRLCAAEALLSLGKTGRVGRMGRAPLWPDGAVGSISHTNRRAMAVVSTSHAALGLDCETRLTEAEAHEIENVIFGPDDAANRPEDMTPGDFATLVFSAKEAVYKAIASELTDIPDFREAAFHWIRPKGTAILFRGRRYPVRYVFDKDECVTLIAT